ncbi:MULTISPECIES: acetolactate synthase 2 small subunit [Shewanella]|uniref:Acetolactate synthase 2 small subunit n=1 Tax=Shewanella xiamenensis TaxID=332186 RepID=A0AAE4TQ61_9GAMM|nr:MULTISPECIES: acetolactate synthase 2 small subunit [Shewanella]MDV5391884.1 acetolactate synthase 2 small subunit [Shewanella xiamenensis]PWH03932.1 acetolactate synthase 2 small subunit [Shewanella xiamenensis]
MIHSLELTVQQRPEVLERVLRVTRHRGFTITQMQMRMNDDASLSLDMEVDSERAIELLSNQLNKLIDVTQCKVLLPLNLQQQKVHA